MDGRELGVIGAPDCTATVTLRAPRSTEDDVLQALWEASSIKDDPVSWQRGGWSVAAWATDLRVLDAAGEVVGLAARARRVGARRCAARPTRIGSGAPRATARGIARRQRARPGPRGGRTTGPPVRVQRGRLEHRGRSGGWLRAGAAHCLHVAACRGSHAARRAARRPARAADPRGGGRACPGGAEPRLGRHLELRVDPPPDAAE